MDDGRDDTLWCIQDAADYLRVPVASVYKMTGPKSRNPIPHIKVGGRLRFRRKDIDRWLDLQAVSSLENLERARARVPRSRGGAG